MRVKAGVVILTGAVWVLPIPASAAARLTITPREALIDAPVVIRVEGVAAKREIVLRASARIGTTGRG